MRLRKARQAAVHSPVPCCQQVLAVDVGPPWAAFTGHLGQEQRPCIAGQVSDACQPCLAAVAEQGLHDRLLFRQCNPRHGTPHMVKIGFAPCQEQPEAREGLPLPLPQLQKFFFSLDLPCLGRHPLRAFAAARRENLAVHLLAVDDDTSQPAVSPALEFRGH